MKYIEEGNKIKVYFSIYAASKIMRLVLEEKEEIGWRMFCRRGFDGEECHYYVNDIAVYPQTVGPASVDTDEAALAEWENTLDDDKFNHMRGHGHSHVSMGVSPSGTDIDHQKKILKQLGPNDFYIFIIVNKNLDIHFDIYDKSTMLHYETEDIEWKFEGSTIDTSKVKRKPKYVFGGDICRFPASKPKIEYHYEPKISCKDDIFDPTGSDLYDMFMKDDEIGRTSNRVSSIWDDIEGDKNAD